VHDLWGADGVASPPTPGDNGDWSTFDAFYTQLISDVRAGGHPERQRHHGEPDAQQLRRHFTITLLPPSDASFQSVAVAATTRTTTNSSPGTAASASTSPPSRPRRTRPSTNGPATR